MEAVKKGRWYFMVLILLHILKVTVQQTEAVGTVGLKEGMVLDCLCPWDGSITMISWTKVPEKTAIAVFHPALGTSFSQLYRERIEFLRRSSMDGGITMKNVTHQDIGVYHCSVQTFPQGPWTRTVQVEDLDEPPAEDDEHVAIFEFPDLEPFGATSVLGAELNENLTISCHGLPNVTIYQVIMEKMVAGLTWEIIAVCKIVNGGLLSEDYSDRGSIMCSDSLDVSLHLVHVQQEDSGFYRCNFSTETGLHTTTMILNMADQGGISLSVYMFYVYCGAGTAGLLLLIAIILVVIRHRNKNKRLEYRVKKLYPHRQPNYYENISVCPREGKRPRQIRDDPVYANLHYARVHNPKCRICSNVQHHNIVV